TDQLSSLLVGPSAVAFVDGDVVEAAKGLRDFARANPLLVIKGGVLDGKAITPSEIIKLADLESREVLLAKLAGAMKASLAGAADSATPASGTTPETPDSGTTPETPDSGTTPETPDSGTTPETPDSGDQG